MFCRARMLKLGKRLAVCEGVLYSEESGPEQAVPMLPELTRFRLIVNLMIPDGVRSVKIILVVVPSRN